MKKFIYVLGVVIFWVFCLKAQTNILSTNAEAEKIMMGNYDAKKYAPSTNIDNPQEIVKNINSLISPDSLKSYLIKLSSFKTRNTGSDTLSETEGIGAARRWVYSKYEQISQENNNRLIPSYLQFDQTICTMGRHKNIFAVLPGTDTSFRGVILVEAHIDSRCANVCDVKCIAQGMEDNGSGTALVLELARVMGKMSFKRTIVFVCTIGEEQGLNGATAFVQYVKTKKIPIIAVLNNDVIGGIICGKTSSAPSCPGLNNVDSTQVRLFSSGGFNSRHKQLSRFIKLEYTEELKKMVNVPMKITIMSAEDRTGRGGDHIPFRESNYAAMRFTSANEHGNADVANTSYIDRQHTSSDILGVDRNNDKMLDSFFVDFNYLGRNTAINGVATGMAALGPATPTFTVSKTADSCIVVLTDPYKYGKYRVFLRTSTNDFDTAFTTSNLNFTFAKPNATTFYVSVASVDENGIESLFSNETIPLVLGVEEVELTKDRTPIELLQNRPNPFDEATIISFIVHQKVKYNNAFLLINDTKGNPIWKQKIDLNFGLNEILYEHGYGVNGVYSYSIVLDGKVRGTKQMVFAN